MQCDGEGHKCTETTHISLFPRFLGRNQVPLVFNGSCLNILVQITQINFDLVKLLKWSCLIVSFFLGYCFSNNLFSTHKHFSLSKYLVVLVVEG